MICEKKFKPKIMHYIHGLNTGGAETLVKDYMLFIDREKFNIVLVCKNHVAGSPYEHELNEAGIDVIYAEDYLGNYNSKCVFGKIKRYFDLIRIIRKIVLNEKPDVIHSHLHSSVIFKNMRLPRKIIFFHTVHSDPGKVWPNNDKKKKRDFRAAKWLVKHRSMRFITLHEDMREEINKMFEVSDSLILNNGIRVDSARRARRKEDVRMDLGISRRFFVLGHVGRFSTVKNHVFLVDVFFNVYKKNNNAFLLMVGDGEEKKAIEKRLRDKGLDGHYLILSNRNDVPDLLNAMDVFVFPSLYEGLPLSLIEAQVSKKPCYISNTINKHAVISNLVTQLSLDDGPEKWAEAILKYKKPKKIEVNDEDWDIKKITKQLEQLYLDALAEKDDGEKQD